MVIKWQLPVKQSNLTTLDWIHPRAKYHCFKNDVSLCELYYQKTEFLETDLEEIVEKALARDIICKKCYKKYLELNKEG